MAYVLTNRRLRFNFLFSLETECEGCDCTRSPLTNLTLLRRRVNIHGVRTTTLVITRLGVVPPFLKKTFNTDVSIVGGFF